MTPLQTFLLACAILVALGIGIYYIIKLLKKAQYSEEYVNLTSQRRPDMKR